jgi:hypothetical protein
MGVSDRVELDRRSAEAAAIREAARAAGRELTADEKARVKELVEPFEKWARGFEAYLMEGKAPSLSLAGAFRTFKHWLSDVYRNISALKVGLSPEIRGVSTACSRPTTRSPRRPAPSASTARRSKRR